MQNNIDLIEPVKYSIKYKADFSLDEASLHKDNFVLNKNKAEATKRILTRRVENQQNTTAVVYENEVKLLKTNTTSNKRQQPKSSRLEPKLSMSIKQNMQHGNTASSKLVRTPNLTTSDLSQSYVATWPDLNTPKQIVDLSNFPKHLQTTTHVSTTFLDDESLEFTHNKDLRTSARQENDSQRETDREAEDLSSITICMTEIDDEKSGANIRIRKYYDRRCLRITKMNINTKEVTQQHQHLRPTAMKVKDDRQAVKNLATVKPKSAGETKKQVPSNRIKSAPSKSNLYKNSLFDLTKICIEPKQEDASTVNKIVDKEVGENEELYQVVEKNVPTIKESVEEIQQTLKLPSPELIIEAKTEWYPKQTESLDIQLERETVEYIPNNENELKPDVVLVEQSKALDSQAGLKRDDENSETIIQQNIDDQSKNDEKANFSSTNSIQNLETIKGEYEFQFPQEINQTLNAISESVEDKNENLVLENEYTSGNEASRSDHKTIEQMSASSQPIIIKENIEISKGIVSYSTLLKFDFHV